MNRQMKLPSTDPICSSVAYSKYKELVYENAYEKGFVNVDLNDNESGGGSSIAAESGCVSATPSTPRSEHSSALGGQQLKQWRTHSETEI